MRLVDPDRGIVLVPFERFGAARPRRAARCPASTQPATRTRSASSSRHGDGFDRRSPATTRTKIRARAARSRSSGDTSTGLVPDGVARVRLIRAAADGRGRRARQLLLAAESRAARASSSGSAPDGCSSSGSSLRRRRSRQAQRSPRAARPASRPARRPRGVRATNRSVALLPVERRQLDALAPARGRSPDHRQVGAALTHQHLGRIGADPYTTTSSSEVSSSRRRAEHARTSRRPP